jgi:hypothetical protein
MKKRKKQHQPSNRTTNPAISDETVVIATQSETISGRHFPVVQSLKHGIKGWPERALSCADQQQE